MLPLGAGEPLLSQLWIVAKAVAFAVSSCVKHYLVRGLGLLTNTWTPFGNIVIIIGFRNLASPGG